MKILLNHVHVVPDGIDAFIAATYTSARTSVATEPGCSAYDVFQYDEDPTRFVLYEEYADEDAFAAHKSSAHYETWRDTVAPLMAEPRHGAHLHPAAEPGN
jgi:autoinducer 2-degrading protein